MNSHMYVRAKETQFPVFVSPVNGLYGMSLSRGYEMIGMVHVPKAFWQQWSCYDQGYLWNFLQFPARRTQKLDLPTSSAYELG
jgi:hypothetical protein